MTFSIQKKTTVISIVPTPKSDTGENQYQITFGKFTSVSKENAEYYKPDNGVPPKTFPTVDFVLFVDESKVPYKVGDEWELSVKEIGELSIRKLE